MQFSHVIESRSMPLLSSNDLVFNLSFSSNKKKTYCFGSHFDFHNHLYMGWARATSIMFLSAFCDENFEVPEIYIHLSAWAVIVYLCREDICTWYCWKASVDVWNICYGIAVVFAFNRVISLRTTYDISSGYASAWILSSHLSNHNCTVLPSSIVTIDSFLYVFSDFRIPLHEKDLVYFLRRRCSSLIMVFSDDFHPWNI